MTCIVCGRPISSSESLKTGLGPTCREHRKSSDQPELFEGLARSEPVRIAYKLEESEVIDFDKLRGRRD